MRRFVILYTIASIWTFGWATGTFGFLPSTFLCLLLSLPVLIGWRILEAKRDVRDREYWYVGLVSAIAVCASVLVVHNWYDVGMHRRARFAREIAVFDRHVQATPEFKSVSVSHTMRKGGRVYLKGSVANAKSHERLMHDIEWMIRNNDSGYHDGVDYPGKPNAGS